MSLLKNHSSQPSKASRKPALYLTASVSFVLFVLAGSTRGAVRFDVVGAPTEVINTGRSEVLGSINLFVRGASNTTGTSTGGAAQIGLVFANPALAIDNTTTSGIRLFSSPGLAAANPSLIGVTNQTINGQCAGFLAINLQAGATPADGDFIRIEGIRGAIDASAAVTPGTDLFLDLQSINDPSANSFHPSRIRVAKSLKGMNVEVVSSALSYEIHITEGFARAFVDNDANNDGVNQNDRTDSGGNALGAPTNSTQFVLRMDGIPDGISSVSWPQTSTVAPTGAALHLLSSSFSNSSSTAEYSFEAIDQVNKSDQVVESFSISPTLIFGGGKCNTEDLTTSVTLGPPVPPLSGCAAPSADASRPRFLEVYELSIISLSPSSAVVAGKGFTLTVKGTGFLPGSVVQWNGATRATTYVSSTQLTAAIPASDIAKAGTVFVTVAHPSALGGAVAGPAPFAVLPHALSLYYPRLVAVQGSSSDTSEFTGIALANISPRNAHLTLTAFDPLGMKINGANITNPAILQLNANQQLPVLASQIFGEGIRSANAVGWIKVEGDVPEVVGSFLSFNSDLSRMDGADVSSRTMTSFVFPELQADGFSQFHMANPNDAPAHVALDLVRADGTVRARVSRTINSNGLLVEFVEDLFPGITPDSSDYVRVASDQPVVPFEYLGRSSGDVAGLNGQDSIAGSTRLYSAQYAVGPGWETTISVVSLSPNSGSVEFRLIGNDGTQIGQTQVLPISAKGKIHVTDQAFFVSPDNMLKQGYVEITSAGIPLAGSVVFDNPSHTAYSTALPLVSSPQERLVFGQVASNGTFFTGLSLINPNDSEARTIIQVFDRNGNQVAAKIEDIPARGRKSQLLTEYFPALAGVDLSSGYITVDSNYNLGGFALFGTNNLSVLSAIPAQTVP